MSEFRIRVAGQTAEITTVSENVRGFFRGFLTEEEPAIRLQITREAIAAELPSVAAFARPGTDIAYDAEVQVIFQRLSEALVPFGAFLFHGAAIAVGRDGFIFTGNSGIGKSTHMLRWLRRCPDAEAVNGDKPFIVAGAQPLVCGTPWGGKEGITSTLTVPLRAIVLLERAEENRIRQVPLAGIFPMLCQQIYRPDDADITRQTLRLLKSLDGAVSFWRFECNNFRDDCFPTAYRALTGREP